MSDKSDTITHVATEVIGWSDRKKQHTQVDVILARTPEPKPEADGRPDNGEDHED